MCYFKELTHLVMAQKALYCKNIMITDILTMGKLKWKLFPMLKQHIRVYTVHLPL